MEYQSRIERLQGASPADSVQLPADVPHYHDNADTLTALLGERVSDVWSHAPTDLPPWVGHEARSHFRLPRGELGWGECCFPLRPEVVCLPRGFAEFGRDAGRVDLVDLVVLDGMKVINGSPDVRPPDAAEPPPPVPGEEGERCYGWAEPGEEPGRVRLHEYWSYPHRYLPAAAYTDNTHVADVIMALYAFCDVTGCLLDGTLPDMSDMGAEFVFKVKVQEGGAMSQMRAVKDEDKSSDILTLRIRRGIKGYGWPKVMENWVTRTRSSGWPPQGLVDKIGSSPCYYFPATPGGAKAGGTEPPGGDTSWEVCLRTQESMLLDHVFGTPGRSAHTQCVRGVYALLGDITSASPRTEGADATLGSRALLATLYRHMEGTSLDITDQWTDAAGWDRTRDVLRLLVTCLEGLYIPDYFRPEVNLLSHFQSADSLLAHLERAINNPLAVLPSRGRTAESLRENSAANDHQAASDNQMKLSDAVLASKFLKRPEGHGLPCDDGMVQLCDLLLDKVTNTLISSLGAAVTLNAFSQSLDNLKPLHGVFQSIRDADFLCTGCASGLRFTDFLFHVGERYILDNDCEGDCDGLVLEGWCHLVSDVIDMKVLHGVTGADRALTTFYSDLQDTHLSVSAFLPVMTSYILHMNRILCTRTPPRRRQCFQPDPLHKFLALQPETLDSCVKRFLYPAGFRRASSSAPEVTPNVPSNSNLPFFANKMADVQLRQFARYGHARRVTDLQEWCFQGEAFGEQLLPLLATTDIHIGLHYVAILLDNVDIQGATQLVFDLESHLSCNHGNQDDATGEPSEDEDQTKVKSIAELSGDHDNSLASNTRQDDEHPSDSLEPDILPSNGIHGDAPIPGRGQAVPTGDGDVITREGSRLQEEGLDTKGDKTGALLADTVVPGEDGGLETERGEGEGKAASEVDAGVPRDAVEGAVSSNPGKPGSAYSGPEVAIPSGVGDGPEAWVILDKPIYETDAGTQGHEKDAGTQGNEKDAGTQGHEKDAGTQGHETDADTQGHEMDAGTQGNEKDARTQGHETDADTQGHEMDAGTQGNEKDDGTQGHETDADTQGHKMDAGTQGHETDADGHGKDAGTHGHETDADTHGHVMDAEGHETNTNTQGQEKDADTQGHETDTDGHEKDTGTQGHETDADTQGHVTDADIQGHEKDANTQGHETDANTQGHETDVEGHEKDADTQGHEKDADTQGHEKDAQRDKDGTVRSREEGASGTGAVCAEAAGEGGNTRGSATDDARGQHGGGAVAGGDVAALPAGHGEGGRHCLLTPAPHPLLSLLSPRPSPPLAAVLRCPLGPEAGPSHCVLHNPQLGWPRGAGELLEAAGREGPLLDVGPETRSSLAAQLRHVLSLSQRDAVQLSWDMVLDCLRNTCLELTATY